jgi:hypothetical protein
MFCFKNWLKLAPAFGLLVLASPSFAGRGTKDGGGGDLQEAIFSDIGRELVRVIGLPEVRALLPSDTQHLPEAVALKTPHVVDGHPGSSADHVEFSRSAWNKTLPYSFMRIKMVASGYLSAAGVPDPGSNLARRLAVLLIRKNDKTDIERLTGQLAAPTAAVVGNDSQRTCLVTAVHPATQYICRSSWDFNARNGEVMAQIWSDGAKLHATVGSLNNAYEGNACEWTKQATVDLTADGKTGSLVHERTGFLGYKVPIADFTFAVTGERTNAGKIKARLTSYYTCGGSDGIPCQESLAMGCLDVRSSCNPESLFERIGQQIARELSRDPSPVSGDLSEAELREYVHALATVKSHLTGDSVIHEHRTVTARNSRSTGVVFNANDWAATDNLPFERIRLVAHENLEYAGYSDPSYERSTRVAQNMMAKLSAADAGKLTTCDGSLINYKRRTAWEESEVPTNQGWLFAYTLSPSPEQLIHYLKEGADINGPNPNFPGEYGERTAFMQASEAVARHDAYLTIAQVLLELGADPEIRTSKGTTAPALAVSGAASELKSADPEKRAQILARMSSYFDLLDRNFIPTADARKALKRVARGAR